MIAFFHIIAQNWKNVDKILSPEYYEPATSGFHDTIEMTSTSKYSVWCEGLDSVNYESLLTPTDLSTMGITGCIFHIGNVSHSTEQAQGIALTTVELSSNSIL